MLKMSTYNDLAQFNAVEVWPVSEGDHICQVCDEGQEDFWTVYLHFKEGGVDAIEDFSCKEDAFAYAAELEAELRKVIGDELIPMRS